LSDHAPQGSSPELEIFFITFLGSATFALGAGLFSTKGLGLINFSSFFTGSLFNLSSFGGSHLLWGLVFPAFGFSLGLEPFYCRSLY
jgi:hypothetical protein